MLRPGQKCGNVLVPVIFFCKNINFLSPSLFCRIPSQTKFKFWLVFQNEQANIKWTHTLKRSNKIKNWKKKLKMVYFWDTFAPFLDGPGFFWKIRLTNRIIIGLYDPAKFQEKLMTQSWDIECTYIRMDIEDWIHNMTFTQAWVQQWSWIQWNLHKYPSTLELNLIWLFYTTRYNPWL